MACGNKRDLEELRLETILKTQVEIAGGTTRKWISPGNRGVPNRIIFWQDGRIHFVGCASANVNLNILQEAEVQFLKSRGHFAITISSEDEVHSYIKQSQSSGKDG